MPFGEPLDPDLVFYLNSQLAFAQATQWDEFVFFFLDKPYPGPPGYDDIGGRGAKAKPRWTDLFLPVVIKHE